MLHTLLSDFTLLEVISDLFYQPLTSFIALSCQAYTINAATGIRKQLQK